MRLRMVVGETLLPDVMAPEVHQNERSYIHVQLYMSSADLISFHYARILHGGQLHGRPQKNHKTVKIGGGRLPGTIRCVRTPK